VGTPHLVAAAYLSRLIFVQYPAAARRNLQVAEVSDPVAPLAIDLHADQAAAQAQPAQAAVPMHR
jgi:hypothetical protein